MSIRIGFASMGDRIDQHFGGARYWQIYDIDGEETDFVETRKTVPRCSGHCEGGFDHQLSVLEDCEALFVLRIGEGAAAVLAAHGKRVFEAAGELDAILDQLVATGILEEE